jgi:hypothetical protein
VRTLPLTVLFHEGPIARAYLGLMLHRGLRPKRILHLVGRRHPGTGKAVGRWLPRPVRMLYAQQLQEISMSYWPRQLRKDYPNLVGNMTRVVAAAFDTPPELFEEMTAAGPLERYGAPVQRVLVDGLRDPVLKGILTGAGTILFTGGGTVPKHLLCLDGVRFLHVHPGELPYVRGSDGVFWSTLVYGHVGVSSLYLDSGIDTGDIIATARRASLQFSQKATDNVDAALLYRAVFSFYDPILRAHMLLTTAADLHEDRMLPVGEPQIVESGTTYQYMHPRLRQRVLRTIFGA